MSPPKPKHLSADEIALFKRIVRDTVYLEERFVQIPTRFAVRIVALLESAPKPRGRQRMSMWAKSRQSVVIILARKRKAELIASGMAREKAADQAAREAAAKLRKERNLSVTTIKRLMQNRR